MAFLYVLIIEVGELKLLTDLRSYVLFVKLALPKDV